VADIFIQALLKVETWIDSSIRKMTKKNKPEIKLGETVRLKAQSGEIITGHIVHLWEEKSVPMIRVASGQLVYNVPASMLVNETKPKRA
jgi:hypothetical protein